jgi:uracil-DNA glycosylase family 4
MANHIRGRGPLPCRLMIIAERPGPEDYERRKAFVGPGADELFARIWKTLKRGRDDFYATYLVKRFSMEPITQAEIDEWAQAVKVELLRCKPEVVIGVGYAVTRAFVPHLRDVPGDTFQGLAFPVRYGKAESAVTTLVPIVHPMMAIMSPDRYQNALTTGLHAVRDVLMGQRTHHTAARPFVYQVGLANFGKPGMLLASDTEGSARAPECVTLAYGNKGNVACIETHEHRKAVPFLGASLHHAKAVIFHNAPHDVHVLEDGLQIDNLPPVHDTQIMAYLLDLPQSLKVLAYRELGYLMDDYSDLVDPIDEARVRAHLTWALAQWESGIAKLQSRAVRIETVRAKVKKAKRVTKKAIAERFKKLHAQSDIPPNRVISGLRRMLATDAGESDDE